MKTFLSPEARENLRVFWQLCRRDAIVLGRDFWGDLLNMITWPISLSITFGYVLPAFGMSHDYGAFMLISSLATGFFYLSVSFATLLVADFENMRFIEYQLVLPVSSFYWIILQKVCSFSIHSMLLSLLLLPIGKLILRQNLNLEHLSLLKFFSMFVLAGIFYGFFALALAGLVKNQRAFSAIWRRVYTPMQFAGCYWFSFWAAYKMSPWFAAFTLFSPLTFITEGMRNAVFGGGDSLPFLLCFFGTALYTCICAWFGLRAFVNRLDPL